MRRLERSLAGLAGLSVAALALYALLVPALGVLYLTDGYHFDWLPMQIVGFGAVLFVTACIAVMLLVAAALLRAATTGAWPPSHFFVGRPAAVTFGATVATVTVLVLVL